MNIPNFDVDQLITADGRIHPGAREVFTQLFNQLQQNLSNEGYLLPQQTANNITGLTASKSGTMLYDSSNNLMKVNINGTWKTVQTA